MLKIIALYSPDDSYDQTFINNYFKINIEPRLSRVSGVGNVNVMGGDYAMRASGSTRNGWPNTTWCPTM